MAKTIIVVEDSDPATGGIDIKILRFSKNNVVEQTPANDVVELIIKVLEKHGKNPSSNMSFAPMASGVRH